jgi:hypothetical protein
VSIRGKVEIVVSALAMLLASFAAGRASAPERVRTVEVESKRTATAAIVETATAAIVTTRDVTKWRDRIVTKPDGTKIETRETVKDDGRSEEKREEKRAVEIRVEERLVYRERETARAQAPRYAFSLGAGVLIPPRPLPSFVPGLPSRLMLTATAAVRVAGPVYLGVSVTSTRTVGGFVSVAF